MRNFLSEKDLITWEDEDFVAGVLGEDGQFVPGKAAKWRASGELPRMMEQVDEQKAVVIAQDRDYETNATEKLVVPGYSQVEKAHDEEREERRTILYGYKDQDRVLLEEREEGKSILYGYTAYEIPILTPESRQSTKFLEDLQRLGIVMRLQRPRFKGYSTRCSRMAA